MIDKLPEIQIHSCAKINEKLNEVIDWINDVSALRVTDKQVTANLPNIDAGELAFLSKENTELKDELEHTRKALEIAVDALERANNTYCAEEEDITIDLTESAAHKWQRTAYQMEMPISIALEQITAEQKD